MTQLNLDDFAQAQEPEPEPEPEPEAEPLDDSPMFGPDAPLVCPWCLDPEENWTPSNRGEGYMDCTKGCVIPVHADWVHENRPIPIFR